MFGAALGPLSQAVMLDMYPPAKRGKVMAIWGMGVMLGPILGPTLGGVLTDAYSWRWVFYINVPFGAAACVALWIFFKDTAKDRTLKFDWFGFGALSVGLASLQLLLDRGSTKDWFSSPEIVIEAIVCCIALYLFLVHMLTATKPFIPKEIFKDRNFVGGLVLMFVMGLVLLASSALISPYLQNLSGRSVTQTGFLMVPRGLGMMFAMVFAGRLTMKMDPRVIMTAGAALMLWSLWAMTDWTPDVAEGTVSGVTFVQGLGMGLVFVPMNLVAFATLTPQLRTDGAGLTNLMRNIGCGYRGFAHRHHPRRLGADHPCSACRSGIRVQQGTGCQRTIHVHESANSFWVGKSEFSHRIPRASAGLCQRFPFHVCCFLACVCDYLADEASVFRGRTNP